MPSLPKKIAVNSAAVELTGGRLFGVLSFLNSRNAGGYINPNKIDGFTYNESDGQWYGYPPAPDLGTFGWFDLASSSKQADLNLQRYWAEKNNHIENSSPTNGEAGDLSSPSILDLLKSAKEVIIDLWSNNYINDNGEIIHDTIDATSNPLVRSIIDIMNFDYQSISDIISSNTNSYYTTARNWVGPRDPLVLDLDGGGISTSAINPNAPIYFDQNGDGIRTATGWISAGEALVVRDLNGNGLIDSGRELFGDSTLLTRSAVLGQTAANGFTALADLDSDANGIADGQFNSQDTAFNSVRLWQDINQDGISQANELHTFAELGVIGINVNGVANNINLGGGNSQALSGNFIRSDGQIGSSGTVSLVGSLLLANNNFYRQFTDNPIITETAQNLPQMQGSGWVRDLREAMI